MVLQLATYQSTENAFYDFFFFFFLVLMFSFHIFFIKARMVASNERLGFDIWNHYPEWMPFPTSDCGQDSTLCVRGSLGHQSAHIPTVPWWLLKYFL